MYSQSDILKGGYFNEQKTQMVNDFCINIFIIAAMQQLLNKYLFPKEEDKPINYVYSDSILFFNHV